MSDTFHVISPAGGHLFTTEEWRDRVSALTQALRERNVVPGEHVLAWLPRGWEEAALCQAVHELGAVWVSVPRHTAPDQIEGLVRDAGPVLAVCRNGDRKRLGDGPWIEWPALASAHAPKATDHHSPNGLAALCYTSGSTGRPKGVMVTHENLAGAVGRIESYLRHTSHDRLLSLMPLNSPWGLLQWQMARRAGAGIVLPPAIAMASELSKTIHAAGVTGLAALPPTWIALVDYLDSRRETLPGLRYVTTSGGALPRRILDLFPKVFPNAEVWMTYGLTEAFRTTVLPAGEFERLKGSLGKPCPGVRIEILRADGTPAGTDEPGELVHLGDCVTQGYWRQPELTREVFNVRPGHEAFLGNSPVHYSGDRVRRDAEGYLWFEGREDELIKTGGYRTSATLIEDALHGISGVVHAVVGGVPDEVLGQRIIAAVETESARHEIFSLIRPTLRRTLSSHQQPHAIHLWPGKMPLNTNGKLDRTQILRWLLEVEARSE
ncbi:AMP-binding protein [Luteolibacter ambystomatis]|uniref:AMP-binding protein n=1 Tax=Luteolibacter ambystomatis TaxID=2824561 RepID=A0A975IZN1_9BACT|nr:AMP-binding protein [Luteolibacter ambystomatis]QUE51389.1 AMP-binding protein [Luteolibacter ambystomatis]